MNVGAWGVCFGFFWLETGGGTIYSNLLHASIQTLYIAVRIEQNKNTLQRGLLGVHLGYPSIWYFCVDYSPVTFSHQSPQNALFKK